MNICDIMICAIIQARMGSTRLPNKVLMDLNGKSVLENIINRLKMSKYIDEIIVATSINSENKVIEELCRSKDVFCFKGNEGDVLDRYYQTCKTFNISNHDNIVRITADCPLIDYEVIDDIIFNHIKNNNDYTSNTIQPSFPDGLDCEIFTFLSLETAWKNAVLSSEREHVTLYIKNHPELFKLENILNSEDLSDLRWTLDEKEDFEFINKIYSCFLDSDIFLTDEILEVLREKPDLLSINNKFRRDEGLEKSLKNDKVLGKRTW